MAGIALFLLTAFRAGWTRQATDFPNYYAAAKAVRQHLPLRNLYDWTSFQKQIDLSGYDHQLGSYGAQPPLSMLPMLGLTTYAPPVAKRIWITASLAFLGGTIWLLSQVTSLKWEHMCLLTLAGFGSLYTNFLYGQYYVFLLFVLTATFHCISRKQAAAGGLFSGLAFSLKLYGGPLLIYFAVKREWRALAGIVASSIALAGLAVAMFGWSDVHYYLTQVLPRSLEGSSIDPYHPANATLSTFLRRLFVNEPELNPNPALSAPSLFFFLRTFTAVALIWFTAIGIFRAKNENHHRDFAWFFLAMMLLSTSLSSYTYILLLLPTALLLKDASVRVRVLLILLFVCLNAPLRPSGLFSAALFPKLWLMVLLFVVVGWDYRRLITPRLALLTIVFATAVSAIDAARHMNNYLAEPGRFYERVATEPGAILSDYPAISRDGMFYESLNVARARYVLRWIHDSRNDVLAFDGEALYPAARSAQSPIRFQLISNHKASGMQFDPRAGNSMQSLQPGGPPDDEVISPDGRWVAFTSNNTGQEHIWLRNALTGVDRQITGGSCNSSHPAWELDSAAIVFASDCGRALGLTALYRARVAAP